MLQSIFCISINQNNKNDKSTVVHCVYFPFGALNPIDSTDSQKGEHWESFKCHFTCGNPKLSEINKIPWHFLRFLIMSTLCHNG